MNCKKCNIEFDDLNYKPYNISPCCCTFCLNCLNNLKEQICPECNEPFNFKKINSSTFSFVSANSISKIKIRKTINEFKIYSDKFESIYVSKTKQNECKINEIKSKIKKQKSELIKQINIKYIQLIEEIDMIKTQIDYEIKNLSNDKPQIEAFLNDEFIKCYKHFDSNELHNLNDEMNTKIELLIQKLNKLERFSIDYAQFDLNLSLIESKSKTIKKSTPRINEPPVSLSTESPKNKLNINVQKVKSPRAKRKRINEEPTNGNQNLSLLENEVKIEPICIRMDIEISQETAKQTKNHTQINESSSISNEIKIEKNKPSSLISNGYMKEENEINFMVQELLIKGDEFNEKSEHKEAFECYNNAINLKPNCSYAFFSKARLLGILDKNEEAIEYLQRAIDIEPENFRFFLYKGRFHGNLDQFQAAIDCFDRAIQLNPEYPLSYYEKGCILGELNEPDKANDCYQQAIKLNLDLV